MTTMQQVGRIIVGLGIAGLGILCFVYSNFIFGRPPGWLEPWTVGSWAGFLSGGIAIICAILILLNQKTALAALIVAILILVLSFARRVPVFMDDWPNAYKTLALFGGLLILTGASLRVDSHLVGKIHVKESVAKNLIFTGTLCMAAFFVTAGYAHFKWADFVVNLIPEIYPFRLFWTYFAAICLIAGGIGVVIPKTRRLAALLSGIMVLAWFVMLHIPRSVMNPADASDRLGVLESFTVGGMFLVLAGTSRKT